MNKIITMLKVLVMEFVVSMVLLAVIAFVMYQTGMGQKTAGILILLVYLVSTFLGGLVTGKAQRSRRLLWGAGAGIAYLLVLLLVSVMIRGGMSGENNLMLSAACCVLGGCLGGMCS